MVWRTWPRKHTPDHAKPPSAPFGANRPARPPVPASRQPRLGGRRDRPAASPARHLPPRPLPADRGIARRDDQARRRDPLPMGGHASDRRRAADRVGRRHRRKRRLLRHPTRPPRGAHRRGGIGPHGLPDRAARDQAIGPRERGGSHPGRERRHGPPDARRRRHRLSLALAPPGEDAGPGDGDGDHQPPLAGHSPGDVLRHRRSGDGSLVRPSGHGAGLGDLADGLPVRRLSGIRGSSPWPACGVRILRQPLRAQSVRPGAV